MRDANLNYCAVQMSQRATNRATVAQVVFILVLNWFYADTHTCTMSTHLLLHFSFSLPVGLLAGQVEGGLQTIMVSRVSINGVG